MLFLLSRTFTIEWGGAVRLFDEDNQSLEALLASIKKPSPKFILWVRAILKRADGAKLLEKILKALIKTGAAGDRAAGLQHLNDVCAKQHTQNPAIAYSDLLGRKHTRQFQKLEQLLGNPAASKYDVYKFFGIISHQAIHDLLTGKIPDFESARKLLQSQTPNQPIPASGLLGHDNRYIQLPLFDTAEIFPFVKFSSEITPDNRISEKLKNEIALWQRKTLAELKRQDHWTKVAAEIGLTVYELRARLFPIFGPYIDALTQYDHAGYEYLSAIILTSWLAAFPLLDTGRLILFKELRVLSPHQKIGGGRLDALEVLSVGGRQPAGWQVKFLKEMSGKRFESAGQLMCALENKLGVNLSFRIVDWKFAVGDSVEKGKIIQPEDIAEPPAKHLEQIRRYITLANLDYYLHRRDGTPAGIWNKDSPVKAGRLIYFLAAEQPVIHKITMTPEEQRTCFIENVVFRFRDAKFRAVIRDLNNLLVGGLNARLTGRLVANGKINGVMAGSPNLFSNPEVDTLHSVIDRHRLFLDEHRVIEWNGNKNNQPVYLMHLDRLLEAMRQKKIKGDFSLKQGRGFITCLMPDHEERTPSLHIDLKRGIWKCFGCGVYGFFADEPLTNKRIGNVKIAYLKSAPREFKKTEKIAIPDEHHRIMSLAQETLNDRFKNSPAWDYVAGRAIEPELAHSLGAGYGDDELINALLDDYDYDQLIHYGFLGISRKVSSDGAMCWLLRRRGMTLGQMKRQAQTQFGLPYSVLARRITFPLALEGRMTNFYGRATWQCAARYKHRKLSVEHTSVPHGAFNTRILNLGYSEIIVAEGAFDALSLIQMGYPATMAIIGVNNRVILESIARSGKNLAIALDVDRNQTGQTNTQKIMDGLKAMNYSGKVRNFTQDFITEHPDFLEASKDYNEYLKYLLAPKTNT